VITRPGDRIRQISRPAADEQSTRRRGKKRSEKNSEEIG